MADASPSLQQMNRTLIGSVLFIDIVDYSRRTVPEQIAMKEVFIELLGSAVQNVAAAERIMVDTGDGAGVAFLGDPEDALFAALSLRDAVAAGEAAAVGEPGFVRMGINLGPLKVVRDINGHTNMIGDGVNDAQRVMSFAAAGQVMVSHSYYDIISRFSRDYSKLFVYEGTRQDKHVREHEVYRFGPVDDPENLAEKLRDRSRARHHAGSIAPKVVAAPANAHPLQNKTTSRIGLVASAIGAVSVVGAVWSWTSTPEQKPLAPAPAASVATEPDASTAQPAAAPSVSSPAVANADPASQAAASSATASATNASVPESAAEKAGKPDKSAASAPPPKPGTVKLAVQPWGEIYVDGGRRGVSPPLKSLSLAPGKHRIEIRNGEFAPYKESVEIKSGTETTVRYTF